MSGPSLPLAAELAPGRWLVARQAKNAAPKLALEADRGTAAEVSLQELVRAHLAPLDAAARTAAASFLADRVGDRDLALARAAARANEMLRERLPASVVAPDAPLSAVPEVLLRLDDRTRYLRGWVMSRLAAIRRLTLVSPEGQRIDLLERMTRVARVDVGDLYGDSAEAELARRSGFVATVELPSPSYAEGEWTIELEDESGDAVEAPIAQTTHDVHTTRNMILGDLWLEPPFEDGLVGRQIHPALELLQRLNEARAEIASVHRYGSQPVEPDVSVIVPLHRRTDLLQHQLAQFAADPELGESELVYVLDSPEFVRDVDALARQLHELYRVPFTLVALRGNAGISGARNAGAEVAQGRLLLFCDSDVLPVAPGWLGSLVSFHDRAPGAGAVAPKLVYSDGTVYYAGGGFALDPATSQWRLEHDFRGISAELPETSAARVVPFATAACLLVERALLRRLGGFDGGYVQGGYEDADLCLRLAEAERDVWYCPDATLCHLEGLSFGTELRALTEPYNRWLFSSRFGAALAERTEARALTP